ncbi:hypothetical protein CR513_47733, partial [Mucuna pruriens]
MLSIRRILRRLSVKEDLVKPIGWPRKMGPKLRRTVCGREGILGRSANIGYHGWERLTSPNKFRCGQTFLFLELMRHDEERLGCFPEEDLNLS